MGNILISVEDNLKSDHKGSVTDIDSANEIYDEIESIEKELSKVLFPDMTIFYDFGIELDEDYWAEIIEENKIKQLEIDYNSYMDNKYYKKESVSEELNEDIAIDDLFVKSD
jgi:hypothetical protein